MNIAFPQGIKIACLLILAVSSSVNVRARESDSAVWRRYFKERVVNDIQIRPSTNEVLREAMGTNTLNSISSKAFRLRSSSESRVPDIENVKVKMMEYDIEEGGQPQRIRMGVILGVNGRDEAMNGLTYLMDSSTNMGGKPFKQLQGGPGDVCFVFTGETGAAARGISTIFFCRDNVAVQLTLFAKETDLLAVARQIDTAIMAAPHKEKRLPIGK